MPNVSSSSERLYCEECSDEYPASEINEHGLCNECEADIRICPRCDSRVHTDDTVVPEDADGEYCHSCVSYYSCCDRHLRYDHYCDDEEESSSDYHGAVRGYGHTHPAMWLGGPLPRDEVGRHDGYYLGFELEISAQRSDDARKINQWSRDHLGAEIFDPKHDSSVAGFEIATQPMTPEFFEKIPWESFFEMIRETFRDPGEQTEPDSHGLHIHIGKVAFRSQANIAAYSYLLNQGEHLQRIGRRSATNYCPKVNHPVSEAILGGGRGKQYSKVQAKGIRQQRGSVNLGNEKTIEVRSFRSTRQASELRDAVRLVYIAADYIRILSDGGKKISPRDLHWSAFCQFVAAKYPKSFASISGVDSTPTDLTMDEVIASVFEPINTQF